MNQRSRCGCVLLPLLLLAVSAQGQQQDMRLRKKLIATGWDHPDAQRLLQNQEAMDQQPFDGVVVDVVGQREDRKSCRLATAFSSDPWKRQWFQPSIDQLKATRLRRLTDNFLLLGANPGNVDWFDDAGWANIIEHWRLAARIVKESGLKGILFDPELYAPPHAQFRFSAQPQRDQHSFNDYHAKARQRGRQVMEAVAQECPNITLFCYFMNSVAWSATDHADPRRFLATHGYGLYPPFIDGWLDVLPPTVTLVDGCESAYRYNSTEQFIEATIRMKGACQTLVSPENRAKYRAQVQVSFGIYLDAYWNPPTSPWYVDGQGGSRVDRLRANVSTALRCADEYVWIYGEKFRWWPTPNKRVGAEAWPEALPGSDAALRFARDPMDFARNQIQRLRRTQKLVNLARNGDFAARQIPSETAGIQVWKEGRPPVGWNAWQEETSKGSLAWDRDHGAGANGSAKASNIVQGCFIQSHPAQPGQRYAVRAQRRIEGKGQATLRLRWQTAEGRWTAETQDVLVYADGPTEEWRDMMGVVEVPQGAGKLALLLLVTGQTSPADAVWFDDVELYKLD